MHHHEEIGTKEGRVSSMGLLTQMTVASASIDCLNGYSLIDKPIDSSTRECDKIEEWIELRSGIPSTRKDDRVGISSTNFGFLEKPINLLLPLIMLTTRDTAGALQSSEVFFAIDGFNDHSEFWWWR